jgi:hypothetical protein
MACSLLSPGDLERCEMIYMDNNYCYFGTSATNDGSMLTLSGTTWNVYIKASE